MRWKYFIPHIWDQPLSFWEDIWLWPEDHEIKGNMGNKINLTIDALGHLSYIYGQGGDDGLQFTNRLKTDNQAYWIWPYPEGEAWTDEVSMIVNADEISIEDVIRCAKIYLKHMGYAVANLREASREKAFSNVAAQGD